MFALLLAAAPVARAQQNADQKSAEQRIKDDMQQWGEVVKRGNVKME